MQYGMVGEVSPPLRGVRALWRVERPMPDGLREELPGYSPMISHLLYCRGFRTAGAIRSFWEGEIISHDPFLLPDMERAVARLARAARDGERVAVFGDFDCDGVTAAAVLVHTLRGLGIAPHTFIPERADGHGLSLEGLAALATRGVALVVTADCGITAVEEVNVARGLGMDVIVTDHHEARADGSLPSCIVVAPTRHDSSYPWRTLCGAGVAYKLTQALASTLHSALDPCEVLDLVAMGTVADVVPLLDENRSLVLQGLERLRRTDRPGLLALYEVAGVRAENISPTTISFHLAPRLNAANRMGTPRLAYDLVAATDRPLASELAAQLNTLNARRQALVGEHMAALMEGFGAPEVLGAEIAVGSRAPLLVAVGEWPGGISGLLATKLVEAYSLPAFVGSRCGDGTVAVSARGSGGVHIDELLEACDAALEGGVFLGFGGHAGAGGFRVREHDLERTLHVLRELAGDAVHVETVGPALRVDAEVRAPWLTLEAAKRVCALSPFGTGFPEPLFLLRNARIGRVIPRSGGKHAALSAWADGHAVDGILFGADNPFLQLRPGDSVDLVFALVVDEWRGRERVQLHVRDWRLSG